MRVHAIILGITLAFGLELSAQGARTITGDYTFYGDRTHSPEACCEAALEGARIEALAREFGTILTSVIDVENRIDGDNEIQNAELLSRSEVKGEWLADEGEPQWEKRIDADGNYVVRCRIKGKARAISNSSTDFEVDVMRNSPDHRNSSSRFASGDDMYVSVKTPVDGYLSIYLVGENQDVYTLFPYYTSSNNDIRLRRGREYMLFDQAKSPSELGQADELVLTTENDIERNRLYVVFSPNRYSLAVDTESGNYAPRQQSYKDFSRWLLKSRSHDEKMGVKVVRLTITK